MNTITSSLQPLKQTKPKQQLAYKHTMNPTSSPPPSTNSEWPQLFFKLLGEKWLHQKEQKAQLQEQEREDRFNAVMQRHQQMIEMRKKQIEQLKKQSALEYTEWKFIRETAAIKIQKQVRGYLVRKRNVDIIKNIKTRIQECQLRTKKYYLIQDDEKADKESNEQAVKEADEEVDEETSMNQNETQEERRKLILESIDQRTQELINKDVLEDENIRKDLEFRIKFYQPKIPQLQKNLQADLNKLHAIRKQLRSISKQIEKMPKTLKEIPPKALKTDFPVPPKHTIRGINAKRSHLLYKFETAYLHEHEKDWNVEKLNEVVVPSMEQIKSSYWDGKDRQRREQWNEMNNFRQQYIIYDYHLMRQQKERENMEANDQPWQKLRSCDDQNLTSQIGDSGFACPVET